MTPASVPEPLRIALEIAGILDRLGVPYVAAGALASSVHGVPRSTDDVDLVADLRPAHAAALIAALREHYYVNQDAVTRAIAEGASFNAIHLGSAVKVDVFVVGNDPFDAIRVASGRATRVTDDPAAPALRLDRAEYLALRKLEWYRRGGQVSDRQWRDVIGILRAQRGTLDMAEMDAWARRLGVADLLERARREAGN